MEHETVVPSNSMSTDTDALLLKEKSIRTEFLQLKLEYNNQIDEMQAMDVQIDQLTTALAQSDLKQVGVNEESEKSQRDLETSKNKLRNITAELCEKETHVKHMSSQIDECSLYIQRFKTLCCEKLSPTFHNMKKDLAIVDTHVKLLESVCRENSILTNQMQYTIETLSMQHAECAQYQDEIAFTKNKMYEQTKSHEQLNNKLKEAQESIKQFESVCNENKQEIHSLKLEAVDNKNTTTTSQCEIERLTASLALTESQNTEQQLQIENLIDKLKQATDQHKHDSDQIEKTAIELANLMSNVNNNILISMEADEDKISYKSKLDNEILVCISQKYDLDTEIKILLRDVQIQKELLLIETSNNDMMEIEITVCRSQLVDMKHNIEQLTARKEELSNSVNIHSIEHDDIVQRLQVVQTSMEEVIADNAVAQSEHITLSEMLSLVKLKNHECVTQIETNEAFFMEEKARIDSSIDELHITESQMKKNIDEHSGILTRLRSNKEDTKNEIVQMRQVHSKITEETDELKHNLQLLKREYESVCTQNKNIVEQNLVVSETLANMYTQLSDQSQMLSKKNELLKDISDFMQQLNSLKIQTLGVSEQCDSLHKQNIEREEECMRLTSCIQVYSAEATGMTAEICKLDKKLCLLKEEESELKHMQSDYDVVCGKHKEATQQKHEIETDIETLSNLKLNLCLEIAEFEGTYAILKSSYVTKTNHVENINHEITRICKYLDKYKLEVENVRSIETELEELIKKRTAMLVEKKNHQIEVQQLIKVIEDLKEEEINLSQSNTSMVQQISTQSNTIEILSHNIEANTLVKSDLEQEIFILTAQLKDLLLGEQKLIHIKSKIDELIIEKSKIELENATQKNQHQTITKEIQDMGEEHEALHLRLIDMKLEHDKCEQKMSDILVLIQEQQLKKQHIDIDVDVSVKSLQDSVSANEEYLKNYSDTELRHNIRIQEMCSKHTEEKSQHCLTIQNYEESQKEYQLNKEKLEISLQTLQQEISVATTHKEAIEKQTLTKQEEFYFFKNKLLVVDAYSSQMEIVVHKINKLVQSDGVDSCAESNSKVLAELITLVVSFLEWFETTFIYKLHILSNMMLNSQI